MGSKSKMGRKRPDAQWLTAPQPLDHQADKRTVLDYLDDHPDSEACEVAAECFDGSIVIASQALNSLKNDGIVVRTGKRFTVAVC